MGVIGTVISDVTLVKDPSCVLNVPRNSETVISWRYRRKKHKAMYDVCLISVIYVENIMKIPTILLNIRKRSMENQKICLVRSVVKYLSIGAG